MMNVGLLSAFVLSGAVLYPLPKPAMKLYGIVSATAGWGSDMGNTWSSQDVDVASALNFVYGGKLDNDTSTALKQRTNVTRIQYKNFGGTSPKETSSTEIQNHANVAYYRPGLLAASMDAEATTIMVYRAPHTPGLKQLPWDPEHPGGFKASTSDGDRSTVLPNGTATSYITWLRVDSEYMKVVKAKQRGVPSKISPDVVAVLTVKRGFWGSAAASHSLNATVLAPIYHAAGSYPGGDAGVIRYALDPEAIFTAEYVALAFTSPDLLDGLWMDCFGSQPFRGADAWGTNMGPYMVNASGNLKRYGRSGYVLAQQRLVTRVRALLYQRGGTHLYANNVDRWDDAPELLKPGTLLDGGASEAFIGTGDGPCGFDGSWSDFDEEIWMARSTQLMNVSLGGYATMPMIGSAGCQSPQLVTLDSDARATVETFAYASFLLFAGTRAQLLGVVPYRFRDQKVGERGGLEMWLNPMYHWPIGTPVRTGKALSDYQVSKCTMARQFETALILVNPTDNCTDASLQLNGTWYDPTGRNPSKAASSVEMLPHQGRILLAAPLAEM